MPCPAEYVFSSCYFHHLRNPVAAYVKWIEPFQAGYAWTGGGLRGGLRRGGGDGRLRVCGRGCGRDGLRCDERARVCRGCAGRDGLYSGFQFGGERFGALACVGGCTCADNVLPYVV